MCPIKHLSSLTAKNRPGLSKKSVQHSISESHKSSEYPPRMLAVTKEKMLRTSCDYLVLDCFPCPIRSFACLSKSEGLEGQRVVVNILIHIYWTGNGSTLGTLR